MFVKKQHVLLKKNAYKMHQKTSKKDSYKTQDAIAMHHAYHAISRLSRLARRSVMHLALPNSFALWMMCLGCFGSQ